MSNISTDTPQQAALDRAIAAADGNTALMRKLNALGHKIKTQATIGQWRNNRVPAEYCPDIEKLTGVKCEELRPDVNWQVLRQPAQQV